MKDKENLKVGVLAVLAIGALLLFSLVPLAPAKNFPPATAYDTINLVPFLPTTTSNSSTSYYVESAHYHTFQIITYCTNAVSNIISGSLDSVAWTPLATNAVSSSSTNAVVLTQHWARLQVQYFTASGASTNTVNYLGAR